MNQEFAFMIEVLKVTNLLKKKEKNLLLGHVLC